jgi:hypothetical protein
MKISEHIVAMQALQDEHGDLDVERVDARYDRVMANQPIIAFRKILKGRESKPCFFSTSDSPEQKGEKVCQIA